MTKTMLLATAFALALGGTASAQYNGPVNLGSGPTAGGVINEGAINGRPLFQDGRSNRSILDLDALTTGSITPNVRGNGAGPTAGGTIDEGGPAVRR